MSFLTSLVRASHLTNHFTPCTPNPSLPHSVTSPCSPSETHHPPPNFSILSVSQRISDERPFLPAKMLGFSTVDGFMNVKEGVDEMIKYLANEPSVGLFFVQQHAQSSMPHLLNVKDKVVEKVHEVTLHIDDIEDSIYVVRSMTECGLPIADEMIKDTSKSLHIMSASQPKRGLITPAAFSYSVGGQQDGGSSRSYLSSVLNSAKQKAAGLRWPKGEQYVPSTTPLPSAINANALSTPGDTEAAELPLSSTHVDEDDESDAAVAESLENHDVSSLLKNYDKFRFDREAKLEEWLREQAEEEHSRCRGR